MSSLNQTGPQMWLFLPLYLMFKLALVFTDHFLWPLYHIEICTTGIVSQEQGLCVLICFNESNTYIGGTLIF